MTYYGLFVFLPLIGGLLALPGDPALCTALLRSEQQGDLLTLTGLCRNNSARVLTLRYELDTNKQGASGTSRNAQAGNVTVAPQQTITLSRTTIKVQSADHYLVRLRLFDEQGRVVAQDSLRHEPVPPPR